MTGNALDVFMWMRWCWQRLVRDSHTRTAGRYTALQWLGSALDVLIHTTTKGR